MVPKETSSNNLWVGNLAHDIIDADLVSLFQIFGPLDRATIYISCGFGFIQFRNINDAKEAKDTLQGSFFHGNPLRIEFAKPEQGPEFRKIRDEQYPNRSIELPDPQHMPQDFVRNYSDPIYAGFSRKHEQGHPNPQVMPQDFVKNYSHPMNAGFTRQHEEEPEFGETRDVHYPNRSTRHPDPRLMHRDLVRNYSHRRNAGFTRQHPFELPSKVLLINYPPSVHVDNDMINNAMILLGEINRIKTFHENNFSLVEFRSVEEAQRAKEGLQGKLFNDPRITIEYYETSFQSAQTMGVFGHNRPMLASNVSGRLKSYGPDIPATPLSMQGRFHRVISRPVITDYRQLKREAKRSRIDGANDSSYPHKKTSNRGPVLVEQYGWGPFGSNVPSGPVTVGQENNSDGPTSLYGVVFKSARHTTSGTSLPPESYQPRHVDAPEITASQLAQARPLLTAELIASLKKIQPSGRVEGTAGVSAGMPASDITVAPESWRDVDRQL